MSGPRRAAVAGLAYFAVVFGAGFVLGALRVSLLIPWLGKTSAVLVELPAILAIAWIACQRTVAVFDVPSRLALRLVMGGIAFLMLMVAELSLSVLVFGQTISEHAALYHEVHALLGLAGQVAFGFFPAMQLRMGIKA